MPDETPLSFELVAIVAAICGQQTGERGTVEHDVNLALAYINEARSRPECQPTEKRND